MGWVGVLTFMYMFIYHRSHVVILDGVGGVRWGGAGWGGVGCGINVHAHRYLRRCVRGTLGVSGVGWGGGGGGGGGGRGY